MAGRKVVRKWRERALSSTPSLHIARHVNVTDFLFSANGYHDIIHTQTSSAKLSSLLKIFRIFFFKQYYYASHIFPYLGSPVVQGKGEVEITSFSSITDYPIESEAQNLYSGGQVEQ